MEGTSDCSLVAAFAGLSDPRQSAKVLYPSPEIMLLLLCATLAGADDFVEIEVWGERNLGFLRRLLPFQHGIPSHDTLGEVIAMLDPAVFRDCFTGWVTGLRKPMPEAVGPEVIAIDGKTSRRSHARRKGREPRHLLSAWACRQRLVLGQQAVDGKSNEITAIPRLLERLELAGALVTMMPSARRPPSPRPSVAAAATTCWRSRPTVRLLSPRSRPTSPTRRLVASRPTRPSRPTTAGSRPGATPSVIRSTGCSPTAAIPVSHASPISP